MEGNRKTNGADAKQFRDYADECRRMAQKASEQDRGVLMEIAQAWMRCAEEAERKARLC
jgi:hypothetical protein